MPIKTKRWNDPIEPDDGFRLLVCRYRPRALRKEYETWDRWWKHLGPSKELHAEFYGKKGPPLDWETFRLRYLKEMQDQGQYLDEVATMVAEGKTVTLLCSKACENEEHCHRTLLKGLIEQRLGR